MQNINIFIKEGVGKVARKGLHVSPDIPEKKLNNAADSMGLEGNINSVVALIDTTLFGSGKDGFVFTGKKMVYKPMFGSSKTINFNEIKDAKFIYNVSTNDKGKEKIEKHTEISLKSGGVVRVDNVSECDLEKLADFLNEIITRFDFFEDEDQLVALSEMSEELKIAYIKIIINSAYSEEAWLDKDRFSVIVLLMARLDLSFKSRLALRDYIVSFKELDCIETLVENIDEFCLRSLNKLVKISLVKDLFSVYMAAKSDTQGGFVFFRHYNYLFKVSGQEVELIVKAIELDFKMLSEDLSDETLIRGMKELGAQASAIGIPLAAVYLSGSVVGISAAGMTSGLAALGLGGFLGFSSMATGIGVAVLIGLAVYQGFKYLTDVGEPDETERRRLMLNEIIKQNQLAVTYLMEDLDFVAIKLDGAIVNYDVRDEKIRQLVQASKLLAASGKVLTQKIEETQAKCFKLKCPEELDQERVRSLTREATKQQLFTVIMSFYERKVVKKEESGKVVSVSTLFMKDSISAVDMEKLANIFEVIGYYTKVGIIKGGLAKITKW